MKGRSEWRRWLVGLVLGAGLALGGGCAERCERLCRKLATCRALAMEACLPECRDWARRSPAAADRSWRKVEPHLDAPCRTFYRAALR